MEISDTDQSQVRVAVDAVGERATNVIAGMHTFPWKGAAEGKIMLLVLAVEPVLGEPWVTSVRIAPSAVKQTLISTLLAVREAVASPVTVGLSKRLFKSCRLALGPSFSVKLHAAPGRGALNRLLEDELLREGRLLHRESLEAAEVGNGPPAHIREAARASDRDLGLPFLWRPDLRVVSEARPRSLTIAVDASLEVGVVADRRSFVIAALSSSGDCLVQSGSTVVSNNELELDAITLGLGSIAERSLERATILSDSVAAVETALRNTVRVESTDRHAISRAARERFRAAWGLAVRSTDIRLEHCLSRHGNCVAQCC